MHPAIRRVEWDSVAFGRDCYEITALDDGALRAAATHPGHYSVKVEPLVSKALLHEHGFYYCDTLLEPHCTADRFTGHRDPRATVSRDTRLDELLAICHGAHARDNLAALEPLACLDDTAQLAQWLQSHAA